MKYTYCVVLIAILLPALSLLAHPVHASILGANDISPFPKMNYTDYPELNSTYGSYDGYIVEFKDEPILLFKKTLESAIKEREKSLSNSHWTYRYTLGLIDSLSINIDKIDVSSKIAEYERGVRDSHNEFKKYLDRKKLDDGDPTLSNLAKDSETEILAEYTKIFNGMAFRVGNDGFGQMDELPYVKKITPNYMIFPTLMDSVPLINADEAWNLNYTGKGMTVAIIDTGVDYTHPDLGACLGPDCKVKGGYDFFNNDYDPMDDVGHGTHCAGIAAGNGTFLKGIAPDASIYAYKVLGPNGGTMSTVISGIEAATDPNNDGDNSDQVDVMSLSLGGKGDPDDPVSMAVDHAADLGIVVVVAAANSGPSYFSISSPGCARKALTVGATYKTDYFNISWGICKDMYPTNNTVTCFSSRGPLCDSLAIKPDVVAPGALICSSRYDSIFPEGQNPNYKPCMDQKHVQMAGTSMATPAVAGAAILLRQAHPYWSSQDVKSALTTTALDLGYNARIQGSGRIDVKEALTTPILVNISSLSLGWVIPPNHIDVGVSVLNNQDVGIEIQLSAKSDIGIYVEVPSTIVLEPNERKDLTLSIDINKSLSEGYKESKLWMRNNMTQHVLTIPISAVYYDRPDIAIKNAHLITDELVIGKPLKIVAEILNKGSKGMYNVSTAAGIMLDTGDLYPFVMNFPDQIVAHIDSFETKMVEFEVNWTYYESLPTDEQLISALAVVAGNYYVEEVQNCNNNFLRYQYITIIGPDLGISTEGVLLDEDKLRIGDTANISANVKNFGSYPASDFSVRISDDFGLIEERRVPYLEAHGNQLLSFSWTTRGAGAHLTVELDPSNSVKEFRENNNKVTRTLITYYPYAEDLALYSQDVQVAPELFANTNTTVSIIVYNFGSHDANDVQVKFIEMGLEKGNSLINIKSGEYSIVEFEYTPSSCDGACYLNFEIIPNQEMNEINMSNNEQKKLVTVFTSNDWPNQNYDFENTRATRVKSAIGSGVEMVWKRTIEGRVLSNPIISDINGDGTSEIIISTDNEIENSVDSDGIYAIDYKGSVLWKRDFNYFKGRTEHDLSSLAVSDLNSDGEKKILAQCEPSVTDSKFEDYLIVFNHDGEELWRKLTIGNQNSIQVGDLRPDEPGLEIVLGTNKNTILALKSSGIPIWEYYISPAGEYSPPNIVDSPVALSDIDDDGDLEVIALTFLGNLFALDSYGNKLWKYSGEYSLKMSPVAKDVLPEIPGKEILFLTNYGKLSCVSSVGKMLWKFTAKVNEYKTTQYAPSPPSIGDINGDGRQEIAFMTEGGVLYLVDNSGNQIWNFSASPDINPENRTLSPSFNSTVSSPTFADINGDGKLEILYTYKNELLALDYNGKELWRYSADNLITSSPSVADIDGDSILEIIVGTRGHIYALKPKALCTIPDSPFCAISETSECGCVVSYCDSGWFRTRLPDSSELVKYFDGGNIIFNVGLKSGPATAFVSCRDNGREYQFNYEVA